MSGSKDTLIVTSPCDGTVIANLDTDNGQTLAYKIKQAKATQEKWQQITRSERVDLLTRYAAQLLANQQKLVEIVVYDGGKTKVDAKSEVDGAIDIIKKTIAQSTLPELNGMLRVKERPAVGLVGLVTSFNFPIAVAHWTLAPALLAGNAIVWKPSEKTPMVAIAVKEIFDEVAGDYKNLLQVVIGGREVGSRLVLHEQIDMISATGSVAMGQGIKAALAQKSNNNIKPILELGGNNGVIVSEKSTFEHLEFSVNAILSSFLASTGQRCTNTRRLIVQEDVYADVVSLLKQKIEHFIALKAIVNPLADKSNEYGYGVLIDEDSFNRFESAKAQALMEGGEIVFGEKIASEYKNTFFVQPALALMPSQSAVMHRETFAPLLFVTRYRKFSQAIDLLNAPANAGLVNAIYTQSIEEAESFARENEAGHSLINSPKGTGTPAHGMGFGGNKESGEGEILNSADPLQTFTRAGSFNRIAMNASVVMNR